MHRSTSLTLIREGLLQNPVVAILGPRQCGKTTIARDFFEAQQGKPINYFDLENPIDQSRLSDSMLALEELEGLIVVDEVQRAPDLFQVLRVLVDKPNSKQQFLILGSASRELIRQSSESLAGRIHYIELTPFSLQESVDEKVLWMRGGFPRAYLANTEQASVNWRSDYIRTYLEQDIPSLGINVAAATLRRFWMMLCHYHGGILNASEIGNVLGISHHTVQRYIDILTGTFMVRQLNPWYEKISKRQVKSKKIYIRDSGIYHTLMQIDNYDSLLTNPKLGASWEGFALEQLIHTMQFDTHDCYFWATHNSAELDLFVVRGQQRIGFEFKYTKMPKITKSMRIACEDLQLDELVVIYPGETKIRLSADINCIGLRQYLTGEE